jgi:hypothetical protein
MIHNLSPQELADHILRRIAAECEQKHCYIGAIARQIIRRIVADVIEQERNHFAAPAKGDAE